MKPLPSPLGSGDLVGWRLDREKRAGEWDQGVGAFNVGGRWNAIGARAVYCSLDASTAILEVAVHKGFHVLDTEPHVLTWFRIADPAHVHVVAASAVPNANWLRPGKPGAGQQQFGNALLAKHPFVALPSAVSTHSWNLIFTPSLAAGKYELLGQEPFALDTRLNPASGQ